MKEIDYEYSGRQFTIRSWTTDDRFVVAGYEQGQQVTLGYGCDYVTADDLWVYLGQSAEATLQESVRADIRARLDNDLLG